MTISQHCTPFVTNTLPTWIISMQADGWPDQYLTYCGRDAYTPNTHCFSHSLSHIHYVFHPFLQQCVQVTATKIYVAFCHFIVASKLSLTLFDTSVQKEHKILIPSLILEITVQNLYELLILTQLPMRSTENVKHQYMLFLHYEAELCICLQQEGGCLQRDMNTQTVIPKAQNVHDQVSVEHTCKGKE